MLKSIRRRVFLDTSVATRLSVVALLVTLVSLTITATVGLTRGNGLADGLAEDRLVTAGASRADAVESYVRGVQRELASLSVSPATSRAIQDLTGAYRELAATPIGASEATELTEYYLDEVVPGLEQVRGETVGVTSLLPTGRAAVALQSLYTIPVQTEEGDAPIEPRLVTDAGDGSTYSALHAAIHPVYQRITTLSEFDDLFMIEASSDAIVYSVQKSTDFGTSLDAGPLSGTSLSTLIDGLGDDGERAQSRLIDFSAYPPAVDHPRMFVASAVFDVNDTLVGYLAASLSTGPFDDIMTGKGEWQGFGDTGEAYVVGSDGTMRTVSRAYEESPAAFLAVPEEPGPNDLNDDQRRVIAATGTTALVQPVPRDILLLAAQGDGTTRSQNYQGTNVVTSYRQVAVEGVAWSVFSEVAAVEIDKPIEDYARSMLFAIALFVVVVTFLAVRWSDSLLAPIRAIAARLRTVRDSGVGVVGEAHDIMPDGSPSEYLELADNIDQMLERLDERRTEVAARSAERSRIVADFLPIAAAKRSHEGDDVLEHAKNASATVLVIGGVGGMVEGLDEIAVRNILADVVDQLDDLAAEFGLERVKIAGGVYYAVCGVSRVLLDHAPRSVGFAVAATELVADFAAERNSPLTIGAGVDAGEIAVGLTARTGLVYDAWGAAVTRASDLARHSPLGTVAVSAVVREQLPREYLLADDGAGGDSSVVTGRVDEVTA